MSRRAYVLFLLHFCGCGRMAPGAFENVSESDGGNDATEEDATASDSGDAAPYDEAGDALATDGSSSGPDVAPAIDAPLTFSEIGSAVKVSGQFYFTEGPVWDPRTMFSISPTSMPTRETPRSAPSTR